MYITKKKSRIPLFERKAFEKYLSDMSVKGWRFVEFDTDEPEANPYRRKLVFEKLDTKHLYYSIGAFHEDDVQKRNEYISACQNDGWKFVAKNENLYIFCSESKNLPPVRTDEDTEAEVIDSLKPRLSPGIYDLIIIIMFLITLVLSVNVFKESPVAFYSTDYLMFGTMILLLSIAAAAAVKLILNRRFKNVQKLIVNGQEPETKTGRKSMFGQKLCYVLSALLVIPALSMLFISPGQVNTLDYIPKNIKIIKLNDLIKTEESKNKYETGKLSFIADRKYYYQEKLPSSKENNDNKKTTGEPGMIKDDNSQVELISTKQTTGKTSSAEKGNPKITVEEYSFFFNAIAADVYNRDITKNPVDEDNNVLPENEFSADECKKLRITKGRYYYDSEKDILEIMMLSDNIYTIINMESLGNYSDKIANAIAGR